MGQALASVNSNMPSTTVRHSGDLIAHQILGGALHEINSALAEVGQEVEQEAGQESPHCWR